MTALCIASERTLRERYDHPNDTIPYDVWGDGPPLVLGDLSDHWTLERPRIAGHDTGGTIELRSHLLDGRQFERIALLDALGLRPWDGGRWGTPWSIYLRDHGKDAPGTVSLARESFFDEATSSSSTGARA